MLAEYYNIAEGTMPDLKSITSQPAEVRCMTETKLNINRGNFVIKATGYFHPQQTGSYTLHLECKDRCVFYFSTNSTEMKLVEQ